MTRLILIIICAATLSSCARIFFVNSSFIPDYSLASKEVQGQVVGKATGTSSTTYILGIGGLNRKTLVQDAYEDLRSKAMLKSNQYLSNITIDGSNTFILGWFFSKTVVTITADIVTVSGSKTTAPGVSTTIVNTETKNTNNNVVREAVRETTTSVSNAATDIVNAVEGLFKKEPPKNGSKVEFYDTDSRKNLDGFYKGLTADNKVTVMYINPQTGMFENKIVEPQNVKGLEYLAKQTTPAPATQPKTEVPSQLADYFKQGKEVSFNNNGELWKGIIINNPNDNATLKVAATNPATQATEILTIQIADVKSVK